MRHATRQTDRTTPRAKQPPRRSEKADEKEMGVRENKDTSGKQTECVCVNCVWISLTHEEGRPGRTVIKIKTRQSTISELS